MHRLNWVRVNNWLKAPVLGKLPIALTISMIIIAVAKWMTKQWGITTIPLPTNLTILCICAILYFAALILHLVCCPAPIKEFGSRDEFIKGNLQHELNVAPDRIYKVVWAHKEVLASSTIEQLKNMLELYHEEKTDSPYKQILLAEITTITTPFHPAAVQRKLEKQWSTLSDSSIISSSITGILALLCFAGSGYILLSNITKFIMYEINT